MKIQQEVSLMDVIEHNMSQQINLWLNPTQISDLEKNHQKIKDEQRVKMVSKLMD